MYLKSQPSHLAKEKNGQPCFRNALYQLVTKEHKAVCDCDSNHSSPQTPDHIFGLLVEAADEDRNQRQVVKILDIWAVAMMLTHIIEKNRKGRSRRHCYATSFPHFQTVWDTEKTFFIKINKWQYFILQHPLVFHIFGDTSISWQVLEKHSPSPPKQMRQKYTKLQIDGIFLEKYHSFTISKEELEGFCSVFFLLLSQSK